MTAEIHYLRQTNMGAALAAAAQAPKLDYENLYYSLRSVAREWRTMQVNKECGLAVNETHFKNLQVLFDELIGGDL